MKKSTNIKSRLLRFGIENIGIAAFGALITLLPHVSGFFAGKEAMVGVVAGIYWVPPLRDALVARLYAGRVEDRSTAREV